MKKIIYQIRNILNGKVCVGQTKKTLKIRKAEHFRLLRKNIHKNQYLQNAWNKYGESNFIAEELLEIEGTQEEIDDIETQMINAVPKANRYNILLVAGTRTNIICSSETREKMSKAKIGKKFPLEHRASLSKAWKDREPFTEITRIKMSVSKKGSKNHNFGKIISNEVCVKMSEAKQGEKNNRAILTEIQAYEIKFVHLPEGKLNQREIGELYGVTSSAITKIKTGKIWSYLVK